VDRLPGHPEGVPDLLPRPALLSRQRNVHGFHLLGESVQRTDGAQTRCWVGGSDVSEDVIGHACQSSLTWSVLSTQTDIE
jgi:hypothetical protein